MILRTSLVLAVVTSLAGVGAGARVAWAEHAVTASATTVDHDCGSDPEVEISGSTNTITLTGTCTKVAVSGAGNTLTIAATTRLAISGANNTAAVEQVDRIAVSGVGNTVTYKRPLTAKKTKTARTGPRNSIKKIK